MNMWLHVTNVVFIYHIYLFHINLIFNLQSFVTQYGSTSFEDVKEFVEWILQVSDGFAGEPNDDNVDIKTQNIYSFEK